MSDEASIKKNILASVVRQSAVMFSLLFALLPIFKRSVTWRRVSRVLVARGSLLIKSMTYKPYSSHNPVINLAKVRCGKNLSSAPFITWQPHFRKVRYCTICIAVILLVSSTLHAQTRDDFPTTDAQWGKRRVVIRQQDGEVVVSQEPLPEMPEELRQLVEEEG